MPPGEPAEAEAAIKEHAIKIVESLLASKSTVIDDFAQAFGADIASAREYLARGAEVGGDLVDAESPGEDEDEELTGEELEKALRALFDIPEDQPVVIVP